MFLFCFSSQCVHTQCVQSHTQVHALYLLGLVCLAKSECAAPTTSPAARGRPAPVAPRGPGSFWGCFRGGLEVQALQCRGLLLPEALAAGSARWLGGSRSGRERPSLLLYKKEFSGSKRHWCDWCGPPVPRPLKQEERPAPIDGPVPNSQRNRAWRVSGGSWASRSAPEAVRHPQLLEPVFQAAPACCFHHLPASLRRSLSRSSLPRRAPGLGGLQVSTFSAVKLLARVQVSRTLSWSFFCTGQFLAGGLRFFAVIFFGGNNLVFQAARHFGGGRMLDTSETI